MKLSDYLPGRMLFLGWNGTVCSALLALIMLCSTNPPVLAFNGISVQYKSPHGLTEKCIALNRIPGGAYSAEDRTLEEAFCGIDFYSGTYALCPKIFSTSPGTLVYDISRGPFAGRVDAFEKEQCTTSSPVKRGALGEPVSYKTTMNDVHTSATFSTAALLYYHFSRYLDADVHVPVSVYRSMDKDSHLERVTRPGLEFSSRRKGGAMNHSGWKVMELAEQNPPEYSALTELFTSDRKQIFGVLLHPQGDRYGPEINGTRSSGWGEGQNRDFQQTAPFLALRSDLPLKEAIDAGIHEAAKNATLRQAMQDGVSPYQMVFWMKELTEITLLDYIFSQQDRIGNVDYLSYWYWVDGGMVKRHPADSSRVPDEIAAFHPIRIKRTQLNDNDAGGRVQYANFTKKTLMLENIRHYSPDTYRRLIRLANDFAAQKELFKYVRDNFGLSDAQFQQVAKNIDGAADILRDTCHAGKLKFDLEPSVFLATGEVKEHILDCDKP